MPAARERLGFLLSDSTRLLRRAFQARLQGSSLTLAQARALIHACRRPDPSDRRAWQLYVTAAAEPQLDEIRKVSIAIERDALRGLDPAKADLILEALALIRSNLCGH